ncbi:hypothetical protein [Thermus sp.]|uniref:hypothetical protein n=1 Tax=Thermus sp. TaxID=275 RepID=UPI003D0E7C93
MERVQEAAKLPQGWPGSGWWYDLKALRALEKRHGAPVEVEHHAVEGKVLAASPRAAATRAELWFCRTPDYEVPSYRLFPQPVNALEAAAAFFHREDPHLLMEGGSRYLEPGLYVLEARELPKEIPLASLEEEGPWTLKEAPPLVAAFLAVDWWPIPDWWISEKEKRKAGADPEEVP